MPGVISGSLLMFILALNEFLVSLLLTDARTVTLPVQIYGQLEFSPDPSVAAVSAIMIFLTVLMMVVIDRILGLQRFARS
jgi:putative spermidine/putrescine transport system permease protein